MGRLALVTGGAGFIGGHVAERLLSSGWRVRVLDNLSTGSRDTLQLLGEVEFIEGDIRDLETCRRACQGVDTVFHLAALVSVVASVDDPAYSSAVNVAGTLNVLLGARAAGAGRLVFSSSCATYGNVELGATPESRPPHPESPYATDKVAGEWYCRNFQQLYGLDTVILRYFNVFGPRQNAESGYAAAIPAFIKAVISGRSPIVFGDGLQTRDFVYVENVAEANRLAAEVPEAAGGTFNIASGRSVSLLDLLDELGRAARQRIVPEFREARRGEVRHSRADISQAERVLGYHAPVSLGEGLARTLDWYSSQAPAAALAR